MRDVAIFLIFSLGAAIIGVAHFTSDDDTNASPLQQQSKNKESKKERIANTREEQKSEATDNRNDTSKSATPIVSRESDEQAISSTFDRRVRVTLRSGTQVEGVVKQGLFIEKKSQGVYSAGQNYKEPGAGIRLWYVDHSPGFLFLPYTAIKKIRKMQMVNAKAEARKSILSSRQARKFNSRRRIKKNRSEERQSVRQFNFAVNAVRSDGNSSNRSRPTSRKPLLKRGGGGGC